MISDKDRGQLLRMAGNIACGLVPNCSMEDLERIPKLSARLALETLKAVDDGIAKENGKDGVA